MKNKDHLKRLFWYWWGRLVSTLGLQIEIYEGGSERVIDLYYHCESCRKDMFLELRGEKYQTEDQYELCTNIAGGMKNHFRCANCKET